MEQETGFEPALSAWEADVLTSNTTLASEMDFLQRWKSNEPTAPLLGKCLTLWRWTLKDYYQLSRVIFSRKLSKRHTGCEPPHPIALGDIDEASLRFN